MKTSLKIASIALFILCAGQITSSAQSEETGFKLKHRSAFSDEPARNPFWPIGWVKGEGVQADVEQTAVLITAESFVVTSISTGTTPLAVINGKTYAEGEVITAMYGGQTIKIQVLAINDGSVVLKYLDKKYTVEMKHPELAHPQQSSDDDTLLKKDSNVLILH